VTSTSNRTINLRAIASADSAPQLWELRCEIREALVAYLRDHHPEALPTIRAQMQTASTDGPGGPVTAPDDL
jgi:hypothetical protein